MARAFRTVFKRQNDKKDWTDYKSRNTFGWKVLSVDNYNDFINSEEAKKIFIKLGHSEIMEIDIINNEIDDVQIDSDLLNVKFSDNPPLGQKKNYQTKEFNFEFIVYFAFDTFNKKLYVGTSINGGDRMTKYEQLFKSVFSSSS